MADLVTRLLLQSKQFDDGLKKSESQIGKFQGKTGTAGKSVSGFQDKIADLGKFAGASLLKFAGVAGVAIGGFEVFEKTMRGSQTTSDMFDNNMNAAKDSVDLFFSSLSRGDWSAFKGGIIDTFRGLKELSALLDELADKKLSLTYIRASELADIEAYEQIAKDTTKTIEERTQAANSMKAAVETFKEKVGETGELQMEALVREYRTKSGLSFEIEELEEFIKYTNFYGEETAAAQKVYKEYLRLKKESDAATKEAHFYAKNYGNDPTEKHQKAAREKFEAYRLYEKENSELVKQGWLAESIDEDRQKLVQTLIEQLNLEREISALGKRADETSRGVSSAITTEAKNKVAEKQKQVAEKEKKEQQDNSFFESVDAAGLMLHKEFAEKTLKMPDVPIKFNVTPQYVESEETSDIAGSITDAQKQIQDVTVAYNEATSDALRSLYAKRKTDMEKHLEEITDVNEGMLDISKEINSLMNNNIMNAFESIGDAITANDAGESMRNMLIGLMDMLKQFGAALVAAGMAKIAFDSLLINPIAAIAAGGALIIATSAAKSALQKAATPMANGGIVYGETFARVGEYSGASTNPEVVAPLNKLRALIQPAHESRDLSGEVEFILSGDVIRGVLRNNERIIGRRR